MNVQNTKGCSLKYFLKFKKKKFLYCTRNPFLNGEIFKAVELWKKVTSIQILLNLVQPQYGLLGFRLFHLSNISEHYFKVGFDFKTSCFYEKNHSKFQYTRKSFRATKWTCNLAFSKTSNSWYIFPSGAKKVALAMTTKKISPRADKSQHSSNPHHYK